MATREELHSTRGRAHLLFEALTGDLLQGGFTDDAIHQALDLCLSCKSCKTECPAAVDMAMYKAEFLAHYHQRHSRPLTAHLFGRINEWAPLAARMPRLANTVSCSFIGSVFKRLIGIHRDRPLPRFAMRNFRDCYVRHGRPKNAIREVVLFPDTFTNYFQPQVASAAVAVLENAGFQVTLPPKPICCGRPLYDYGMLELAKQRLLEVMQVLGPYTERGLYIVGVEPGCILTFRDELPKLFPALAGARMLAERSLMLDEFLVREAADFIPPPFAGRALVHGHCHHKAIVGLDTEINLLRRVPGLELEVLDSGCCGMAGAFGYDHRHFEISRALAERVLLPAIRRSPPDALVISDGFSCRSQIRCFSPRTRVMHLAEVLNATRIGKTEAPPPAARSSEFSA